jgi:hypothetical protein
MSDRVTDRTHQESRRTSRTARTEHDHRRVIGRLQERGPGTSLIEVRLDHQIGMTEQNPGPKILDRGAISHVDLVNLVGGEQRTGETRG